MTRAETGPSAASTHLDLDAEPVVSDRSAPMAAENQAPGLCARCHEPWVAHGGTEEPICHDERAAYGPPFCSVQGCRGRWQPDMPHNHEVTEPYLGGFSRSQVEAMTREATVANACSGEGRA